MKSFFAASVLTLALGAFAAPASAASAGYTGMNVWNQSAPYSSAPAAQNTGDDVMSFIEDGSTGAQDAISREQLFEIKDNKHLQW